jgi:hypothetical protein
VSIRLLIPAFVVVAALVTLTGLGTGPTATPIAEAALDCDDTHRLRVDFIDDDTDDPLGTTGSRVHISPDPRDGVGGRDYVDNGSNDDSSTVGRIEEQEACEITGTDPDPTAYTITVEDLPENCSLATGESTSKTTALTSNSSVSFMVECELPTVEVTPDNLFVSCGSRTDVMIEVEVDDDPAPEGTEVDVSTNFGSVSPSNTETDEDGEAEVEYRAPNTSGTATVTAEALGVTGSATIQVSCGAAGPASLGYPTATCSGGRADVTFWWGSNHAGNQWLDLSVFDNGFSGGFQNAGPLSPSTERFTWNGLIAGIPHFWRINTLVGGTWVTSSTGTFVPCGGPEIRGISYACIGGGRAIVTFHFSPATPPGRAFYLDLSIFNNGFADGSFINAPLGHDWLNYTWSGILANTTHFWRVSSLFGNNWARSSTGQFTAFC